MAHGATGPIDDNVLDTIHHLASTHRFVDRVYLNDDPGGQRELYVELAPDHYPEGLVLAHVLEERVGRLTVVLEIATFPQTLNGLAGESRSLLDDRIAEVPTAEYHPEIQFSQRV